MVAESLLKSFAPAKINLNLEVLGRRSDGYHNLRSLVSFANFGDDLTLDCSRPLGLSLEGVNKDKIDTSSQNLVLKAAYNLKALYPNSIAGHFHLTKKIPVAAGLGGGSADAAAALRLLAQVNSIKYTDPILFEAASRTGADVPVCLASKTKFMQGIGNILSDDIDMPLLYAVLVNPGVHLSTADVFNHLKISEMPRNNTFKPTDFMKKTIGLKDLLKTFNDLQPAAIELYPVIAEVILALQQTLEPDIVRMSGSGATCFALYTDAGSTGSAATIIRDLHPDWWVKTVFFGSSIKLL